MADGIEYLGTFLILLTAAISGYSLLFKNIESKRIIAFAAIGFFSGAILFIGERVTSIRLPMLGEIVAKAKEDAKEIESIRAQLEKQISDSNRILGEKIHNNNAVYIKNQIEELENKIPKLESEYQYLMRNMNKGVSREERDKNYFRFVELPYLIEDAHKKIEELQSKLAKKERGARGNKLIN